MSWNPPSIEEVKHLVNTVKTVAIVGVSNKADRPSHGVAKSLIDSGDYEIYLVNPLYDEVLGKKVYKTLEEIPVPIDLVDVFRKVSDLPPVFESAKKIGAKNIWLQKGIVDEVLAADAQLVGMGVVMDRCLMVDHDLFKTRS
jgi:predicted CoA-binding protein